jgi:hypothetical protein
MMNPGIIKFHSSQGHGRLTLLRILQVGQGNHPPFRAGHPTPPQLQAKALVNRDTQTPCFAFAVFSRRLRQWGHVLSMTGAKLLRFEFRNR